MEIHNIEYSTIEQQLSKLQSQGLIIDNRDYAISQLKCYGYSNLIKSYRKPYMITENGQKKYRANVTFEQIASLHELDKNIRNSVMASMQDLEEHFKELSADVIAHSFGTSQEDYLKFRNYQNKRKTIKKFQLGTILDSLRDQLSSPKNPIHYYYTNYGIVCSRSEFLTKILKTFDKNFREILPEIRIKKAGIFSPLFDIYFVNNSYSLEVDSSAFLTSLNHRSGTSFSVIFPLWILLTYHLTMSIPPTVPALLYLLTMSMQYSPIPL